MRHVRTILQAVYLCFPLKSIRQHTRIFTQVVPHYLPQLHVHGSDTGSCACWETSQEAQEVKCHHFTGYTHCCASVWMWGFNLHSPRCNQQDSSMRHWGGVSAKQLCGTSLCLWHLSISERGKALVVPDIWCFHRRWIWRPIYNLWLSRAFQPPRPNHMKVTSKGKVRSWSDSWKWTDWSQQGTMQLCFRNRKGLGRDSDLFFALHNQKISDVGWLRTEDTGDWTLQRS